MRWVSITVWQLRKGIVGKEEIHGAGEVEIVMADGKQDQRDRIRAAMSELESTLRGIVETAEQKRGERCPYRTAKDECTFRGGCVNKQGKGRGGPALCGGDHQLRWK